MPLSGNADEFHKWKQVIEAKAKEAHAQQLRNDAGKKMPTAQEFEKNFPSKDKEVAAYVDSYVRADDAHKLRKDRQLAKEGEFARNRRVR